MRKTMSHFFSARDIIVLKTMMNIIFNFHFVLNVSTIIPIVYIKWVYCNIYDRLHVSLWYSKVSSKFTKNSQNSRVYSSICTSFSSCLHFWKLCVSKTPILLLCDLKYFVFISIHSLWYSIIVPTRTVNAKRRSLQYVIQVLIPVIGTRYCNSSSCS